MTDDTPTHLQSLPEDSAVGESATEKGAPAGSADVVTGEVENAPSRPSGPRLGVRGWVRFLWRQLTSMRTALLLLLLVALAAIPGSVFPQRSIDQGAVQNYLQAHPAAGPVLDAMQMFDVYTSAWFSAVYLLLVISLVGCIIPRTAQFARSLVAPPPAVPRRPERLQSSVILASAASPTEVETAVREMLRRRRYRLRKPDAQRPDAQRVGEVAGESGYLREAGNLLFHYGVVAVIVCLAAGYLVGWRGDRIVPIGESFANNRSAYHTFSGGPLVNEAALQPFVVTLNSMVARFEDRVGTRQLGAPREFRVATTIRDTPGAAPRSAELTVNGPLHFRGAEVYLLGNGYAPVVTVRDPQGQVLYRQATPFLPGDGNYRSTGAIKVPAASPTQLGFSGVFLPTAVEGVDPGDGTAPTPTDGAPTFRSGFPGLNDPLLVLSVYEGTLFPDSSAQSVYRLDTRGMTPLKDPRGEPVRLQLKPGQKVDLPGGRGSVELSSVDRWAGISTRYDPVKGVALWSAIAMLAGLLGSLVIPRRRVFARASRLDDGSTRVVLAGLARKEDAALPGVLNDLADDLASRLPRTTIIEHTSPRTDRP